MSQTQPSSITATPQDSPARCEHRTLKGRCRQSATDNDGTLCLYHGRAQRQAKDDFTLLEPLVRDLADLQSIEGISEDLAALHNMLAEGRISPRRASVFALIDSMLLQAARALQNGVTGGITWIYDAPRPDRSSPDDFDANSPAPSEPASPVADANSATYNLPLRRT